MSRKLENFLIAAVLIVYVLIQGACLFSPWFIADDLQQLAFVNGIVNPLEYLGADSFGLFRPVKNLLFGFFSLLAPAGIAWCRAFAIAIGVATFFPVRAFCKRCFDDDLRATVAAAVWLLSPTLVSCVAWLSCLNIQVMVAFAAFAFILHDRAFEEEGAGGVRYLIGAALCTFVALLCYESAVFLPPALFAFDLILRQGRIRRREVWISYASQVLVVFLYLVIRHFVNGVTEVGGSFAATTKVQMAMAAPYFTLQHFTSWLHPFGRFLAFGSFVWNQSLVPVLVSAWIACAALGVLVLVTFKRAPLFAFGLTLAVVAFGPTSNLLGFGNGPYGDYYLAFASVGLSLAYVSALFGLIRRVRNGSRLWLFPLALLVVMRLAAIPEARAWTSLWGSGVGAFVKSIENFPTYYANKIVVAQWLFDHGKYDEAFALGNEIEAAVGSDSPQFSGIHLMRGLYALNVEKNADKALESFQRSRKVRDDGTTDGRHFYLGCVYEDLKNDSASAEREYRAALKGRWTVDSVPAANRLARMLAIRGEVKEAMSLWVKAHEIKPADREVMHNLASLCEELGEKDAAAALRMRLKNTPDEN